MGKCGFASDGNKIELESEIYFVQWICISTIYCFQDLAF